MRARAQVVVPNPLGLHARGDQTVDGKSILGILLLAASRGSTLTIEADGVDAQLAVEGLRGLVATGFGEIV